MDFMQFVKYLKPYRCRLILTLLGFITAILFFTLGAGKTLLILLCCGIGYFTGFVGDKNIPVWQWLKYFRNKW